jgi:hypothetical protein
MLKTLKWVYDLGVKQERVRIARALENTYNQQKGVASAGYNMLDDPEARMTKERQRKLQFEVAVAVNTQEIVSAILNPGVDYDVKPSIMFPKEEK